MTSSCYVYAVQARGVPLPPTVTGFQQQRLFAVPHHDLEAVASEVDRDALQITEGNVQQHEAVVEAVRRMGPALPVRFGTLMCSPAAIARALEGSYPALKNDLERLGDKLELGLTVLWRPSTADIAAIVDEALETQTAGTRYMQTKLSQFRREGHLREMAGRMAREIDGKVASHALERRCAVLPTERMLMRAAYLLRHTDVEAFQDAFAELSREHPDLRFLLTGPWPPYTFVRTSQADGDPKPVRVRTSK